LPEKYFDSTRKKTAMLTCKNALPDSPHPIIISKNPGFRAVHLAGWNEFRFLFNKYKKIHFWLLASAQKN